MSRTPFHLVVIAVLGLLVYSNTLNAPFQWDEGYYIGDSPIVKDLGYFFEPSKAKGHELYGALTGRYIGYLTFAINYRLHGLDVTGYHIVNIAIHILNALLVYFLVILTFRTPFLGGSSLKKHSKYIALFSGLLFVSHPIQTEAVTYIFQRLTSLMAFFYLLSLAAYVGSRLSTNTAARYALYALSFVSAVFAMKTKENAFTLPLVITLYEFLFFTGSLKRRAIRLIPLLLTLLVIPLTLTGIDKPVGEVIGGMGSATRGFKEISRLDYLLTQFRVIVTYMRLLVLPVNQNLDYDYPIFHSFLNPEVFLSFLFLLSVFGFGIYLFYRSRTQEAALRLTAFGLFWFFIVLSVESSIIPLHMVIDEYRVYLPAAGVFMATTSGAFLVMTGLKNKKIQTAVISTLVLVTFVLAYAAYTRNAVWGSQIGLWEDVVQKSPHKARGHGNLGKIYASRGLTDKALRHYKIALRLKPNFPEVHNNIGAAYAAMGLTDKAVEHYQTALELKPDFSGVHYNLARLYMSQGLADKAIEHYRIALRLKPDYAEAYNNLGNVYEAWGLTDKAIEHYRTAVELEPDYAGAHYNLARACMTKGLTDKAVEHYQTALELKPDYKEAHNNLGLAYWAGGLTDKAIEHYRAAIEIAPDYADAHYNLGIIYFDKGMTEKAQEELETTLQLDPNYSKARKILNYIFNQNEVRLPEERGKP